MLERAYLGKHVGQEFQCALDHVEVGLDLDWCSVLEHTPERVLWHENGFYLNDMNQNSGHLISGVIQPFASEQQFDNVFPCDVLVILEEDA